MIKMFFKGLKSLITDPTCMGCGEIIDYSTNDFICLHCLSDLPRTGFHLNENNYMLDRIRNLCHPMPIHSAFAGYFFAPDGTIRNMIHGLKYKKLWKIGIYLGESLGRMMLENGWHQDYDYLVPMPLHKKRLFERGYNQSEMICRGISNVTGLQVRTDILIRNSNEESQTHKTHEQRAEAAKVKFRCVHPERLKGARIIVVDDVFTTGSTMASCASHLSAIENVRVAIVTVAIAHRL